MNMILALLLVISFLWSTDVNAKADFRHHQHQKHHHGRGGGGGGGCKPPIVPEPIGISIFAASGVTYLAIRIFKKKSKKTSV